MMYAQRISVRNLVEFILRSGDIDNRTEFDTDPEAMLQGGRIHRKIQKSMPPNYQAEVSLKALYEENGLTLSVEGRADGIQREQDKITVDEIKGIYADVRRLTEARPLHLAQAKCYAAMLVKNEELSGRLCCQLSYCNLETEEIRRFQIEYEAEELLRWMNALVSEYFRWARFLAEHREARNRSAAVLNFPYNYRSGQKETAVDVFRAIRRSRDLFIQAPTGVGKTLSVIYPSVKAVAEGLSERVFYLTAKNIARSVAEESFQLLTGRGLSWISCSLSAKEKLCLNEVVDCNPEACPYARGHYDRVNEAIYELLQTEAVITDQVLFSRARQHSVCPYYLSLDLSSWCDSVIADYNYAFDPRAHLKRFFSEGADKNNIFLIDEAHNLPERASEMYSAALKKEDVLALKRLLRPYGKRLGAALQLLNLAMLAMRRSLSEYPRISADPISGREAAELPDVNFLLSPLNQCYTLLSELMEDRKELPERKELLSYFFVLRSFLAVAEELDEHYVVYAERRGEQFLVKLLCIDPSAQLKKYLEFSRSAVFFSATLLPIQYYKDLLTGEREEFAIYAESPFPRERRLLLCAADVSSRYTRRNEAEYIRIAAYIRTLLTARPGNYLCFFPSYTYLEAIHRHIETPPVCVKGDMLPVRYQLQIQQPEMQESQRANFLSAFQDGACPQLGLCVMGGVFSESIDLRAEQLIGVVVVGTGLSAINTESELKRQYYNRRGENGFDYAYRYPGMNKVMQAAGRLIRSENDRGIILLLDERFLHRDYRVLFPREWSDCETITEEKLRGRLCEFWRYQG